MKPKKKLTSKQKDKLLIKWMNIPSAYMRKHYKLPAKPKK